MGRILDKLSGIISKCLAGMAAVVLVTWVFVIVVFVTARSLFNVNWMFVEEYSGYCMVLLTSFSFARAQRKGAHIRVTAAEGIFPPKVRKILKIVADLAGLVVAAYLAWHGVRWFLHGFTGGERSWFPSRTLLWPIYIMIPAGLTALALEFGNQFISGLVRLREGGAERKQGGI